MRILTASKIRCAFMAYYFPPIGGGGTPRSAAFAKWLPEFGVNPTVFSVKTKTGTATREFQIDNGLNAPNSAGVVRVSSADRITKLREILKKIRVYPAYWWAAYPWEYDGNRTWASNAYKAIVSEHRSNPFDVIYATAGPNSSLEFAAKAAKACGVPWVADLRDPWNMASLKHYPSKMHYRWEKQLEKKLLHQATAIIMNTPGAYQLMRDWLGLEIAQKLTWIPNGFEPLSDAAPKIHSNPDRENRFQIVHTGTMYAPHHRLSRVGRYYSWDIDDTGRSLVPLARAVRMLIDRRPEIAKKLRITQMGYAPETLEAAVRELVPEDNVFEFLGVRPRAEAQAALLSADALLVVQVAWSDANVGVPHIPGKVYDYLPLGKPIFAPIPRGDLRRLLKRVPQATVIDYKDPEDIARRLEFLVDRNATSSQCMAPIDFTKLTRESQARDLAIVMKRVIQNEPLSDLAMADFA